MSRAKVEITDEKHAAIIQAVADQPGMVPSEVRWHPVVHAVFGGEGLYLYLEEMAKANALYRYMREGSKTFQYFVVPPGWTCDHCGKPKGPRISPSRNDESICGRCEADVVGPAINEIHRNRMMHEWSAVPLVAESDYLPPSRYAVRLHGVAA